MPSLNAVCALEISFYFPESFSCVEVSVVAGFLLLNVFSARFIKVRCKVCCGYRLVLVRVIWRSGEFRRELNLEYEVVSWKKFGKKLALVLGKCTSFVFLGTADVDGYRAKAEEYVCNCWIIL